MCLTIRGIKFDVIILYEILKTTSRNGKSDR